MFSTGRSINDKEVSLDSEKTNCFLSDPSGMTAHSSAMPVLSREQLREQEVHKVCPGIAKQPRQPSQVVPTVFSPAKHLAPRQPSSNPRNGQGGERYSSALVVLPVQKNVFRGEKQFNSFEKWAHEWHPQGTFIPLFGNSGVYSPIRQILPLLAAHFFFFKLLCYLIPVMHKTHSKYWIITVLTPKAFSSYCNSPTKPRQELEAPSWSIKHQCPSSQVERFMSWNEDRNEVALQMPTCSSSQAWRCLSEEKSETRATEELAPALLFFDEDHLFFYKDRALR